MKTYDMIEIDVYDNYRHNAYDSYGLTWGIILGFGGSGGAFTEDEKTCNCTNDNCDCTTVFGEAIENGENFDIGEMLLNLDTEMATIQDDITEWGEHTHYEYWGERIPIIFKVDENDRVIVSFTWDGSDYAYAVTNLTYDNESKQIYMNTDTGSTGSYEDWWYVNEDGKRVNAVDVGGVQEVEWDEKEGYWV